MKNQDFSKIIFNENLGFDGFLMNKKIDVKFTEITKNVNKPEKYNVKGIYDLEGRILTFSGQLTFNYVYQVKDLPKEILIFGDFKLNGTKPDEDFIKGKFRIQTMKDESERKNFSNTTFKGTFTNNKCEKESETWFSNFLHKDISSVIFK